jgi:hypothetical protein
MCLGQRMQTALIIKYSCETEKLPFALFLWAGNIFKCMEKNESMNNIEQRKTCHKWRDLSRKLQIQGPCIAKWDRIDDFCCWCFDKTKTTTWKKPKPKHWLVYKLYGLCYCGNKISKK